MGMLSAVGFVNLFQYFKMKEPTQLYFVLHILMMMFYQLSLLGVYRLIFGNFGDVLVSNVDVFGIFSITATAFFVNSYLRNTNQRKASNWILNITLICAVVIMVFPLTGDKQFGNAISTSLALISGVALWILSLRAAKENFSEIKYFVVAYSVLILGLAIFTLRLTGLVPNNEWTLLALLITHTIETVLFSLSVAEHVDNYRKIAEKNELAFLKAQIKPHFLYNTLNVIAAIAISDKNKTRELLLNFADYLRYSYDFKNQDNLITFEEELIAVKAYVSIQQARFPNMIEVEYDAHDMDAVRIPQFVIQPLVENAIQHGLRKELKSGKIVVRARKKKTDYEISVEDTGIGMTREQILKIMKGEIQSESGIGIKNIQKRLRLLYGTDLKIESRPNETTTFSFVIPGQKRG
jgi:sensor histidine kinase YesM